MNPRPMVPPLLAFVGGALIGHFGAPFSPDSPLVFAALGLLLASFLVAVAVSPERRKPCLLMAAFLTAGVLLDLLEHRPSGLPLLGEPGEEHSIQGIVEEPPVVRGGSSTMAVRVVSVRGGGGELKDPGRMLVRVYAHPRVFPPGERILFRARLSPFRNFENPGRYDYEGAMRARGFVCAALISDGRGIVPLGRGSLGFFQDLRESPRGSLRRLMQQELWPQQSALYRALILGETHDMGQDLRGLFTSTGLGHVLAVSGLHIGFVAGVVFFLARRLLSLSYRWTLRVNIRTAAALITCVPVIGYSLLTGFGISVQRAMIMVLAYLLAVVLGREEEIWSTLALAALLILSLHPHDLFSISFQLSFGGVIGLVVLLPRLGSLIARIEAGRMVHYLLGLVLTTVSATVFLLPLLLHHFNRISLVTVPANLLVLPFMGFWIIPLGLLAAMVLPLSVAIAGLILQTGALGIDLTLMVMQFFADFPWAEVWTIRPSALEVGLCYGVLVCVALLRRGIWAKGLLALLLVALAADAAYWVWRTQFNPSLRVHYLDVGDGNAALLQFPGRERMLIDGGGSAREGFDFGKMVVAPALLALKIRRVDYMVLSHPEADHMNGLPFIASHFGTRELWHNGDGSGTEPFRRLEKAVREKGILERLPGSLEGVLEIAGVRVELLHPQPGERGGPPERRASLNDRSMVLRLSFGSHSFLFPGDLEFPGEKELLSRHGDRVRSDVLLVPHHGSRGATSADFLDRVSPRVCVISARGGGARKHPHPDLIRRIEGRGCAILRTDRDGAITISSSGERMQTETFRKRPGPSNRGNGGLYVLSE